MLNIEKKERKHRFGYIILFTLTKALERNELVTKIAQLALFLAFFGGASKCTTKEAL